MFRQKKKEQQDAPPLRRFSKFSHLPIELQDQIWLLALPKPRIVTISQRNHKHRRSRPNTCLYDLKANSHGILPTPLLHICRNSRRIALKNYRLCFGSLLKNGRSIYFDPHTDAIFLPDNEALFIFADECRRQKLYNEHNQIRNLTPRPELHHLILGRQQGCHLAFTNYSIHHSHSAFHKKAVIDSITMLMCSIDSLWLERKTGETPVQQHWYDKNNRAIATVVRKGWKEKVKKELKVKKPEVRLVPTRMLYEEARRDRYKDAEGMKPRNKLVRSCVKFCKKLRSGFANRK